MWKHRAAVLESGASGRFERVGLAHLTVFQVLLAPLVDIFLVYGLLFLARRRRWRGRRCLGADDRRVVAFRLEREPIGVLWLLPLRRSSTRQLMYAVLIRAMVTAVGGIRLGWQKLPAGGRARGVPAGVDGRPGAQRPGTGPAGRTGPARGAQPAQNPSPRGRMTSAGRTCVTRRRGPRRARRRRGPAYGRW